MLKILEFLTDTSENEALQKELEDVRRRNCELEAALRSKAELGRTYEETVGSLMDEMKRLKQEIQDLTAEKTRLESWNQELEAKLVDLEERSCVETSDADRYLQLAQYVEYFRAERRRGGVEVSDEEAVADTLEISIAETCLPERAKNALFCGGIRTLGQLISHSPMELMKIRHFGTGSLYSTVVFLWSEFGLRLAKDNGPRPAKVVQALRRAYIHATTIEQLGLSARAYNAVRKAGLDTTAEIVSLLYGPHGLRGTIEDEAVAAEIKEKVTAAIATA